MRRAGTHALGAGAALSLALSLAGCTAPANADPDGRSPMAANGDGARRPPSGSSSAQPSGGTPNAQGLPTDPAQAPADFANAGPRQGARPEAPANAPARAPAAGGQGPTSSAGAGQNAPRGRAGGNDPIFAPPPPARVPPAGGKDPLTGWGPPAAPNIDPRRFTEAHWQGIEVIPNTPLVAQALSLPPNLPGVIVDDVTLPADLQGFQAGDVVVAVAGRPTPDLLSFIDATDGVRDQSAAPVDVVRDGGMQRLRLVALRTRLGTANGETPSMIPPGARMPHPYRGPCTNCHRIGTTGTLPVDQGDLVATTAPTIRAGSQRPHRDRGPCATCHRIVP